MSQLNVYVPEEIGRVIRKKAKMAGKSLSAYIASLFQEEKRQNRWPSDFFKKIYGKWEGDLEPPKRPLPEDRDSL